jgi:hypothetical protein
VPLTADRPAIAAADAARGRGVLGDGRTGAAARTPVELRRPGGGSA